jgi:hypothetical protein
VNTLSAIADNVIPFFTRFEFLSTKKKRDFGKFKQLSALMQRGEHLTSEGKREILIIRSDMNDGGKRRYTDTDILERLENPQRPYARLSPER